MTAPNHSAPGPAGPLHELDSMAGLLTHLTARLNAGLTCARPSRRPAGPVLVAVAHGSREPAAPHTVRALLDAVRAARPGLRVELGHIELNGPLLPDALAALPPHSEAVLVPLLFGNGHHVKHDIPRALAAAPHVTGTVAAPLGPHPLLSQALHDRLQEALAEADTGTNTEADTEAAAPASGTRNAPVGGVQARHVPAPDAVVLAAAGSRDPQSADGTRRIAAGLRERLGGAVPVLPAYASAARPTVAEAVRTLHAAGHHRIALASCFAAPGYFSARCAEEAPWAASAPIGAHPALVRLVLHRFDEARAGIPGCGVSGPEPYAARA